LWKGLLPTPPPQQPIANAHKIIVYLRVENNNP